MQAYSLVAPEGPAGLCLIELPIPTPGNEEVLLRTTALGLNPVDAQTSHGHGFYGLLQHESPLIPGWDVVGEVTAVGAAVTAFKPGDVVFGMVNFPGHGRAWAEYVAAPAQHLARKPDQVSDAQAVAATLAALTAWQVLAHAGVQPGQRVLIHAAAGGVGHYAVQLAKERGAHVIGTASTGKVDFVRSLGADEVVDYTQKQVETVVLPVDVVLHAIRGEDLGHSLRLVKPGGSLISIVGGITPEISARAQEKNVSVDFVKVASNGTDQAALAERLADGRLHSHVARTFPFAQLPEALREVESGKKQGKIVVTR